MDHEAAVQWFREERSIKPETFANLVEDQEVIIDDAVSECEEIAEKPTQIMAPLMQRGQVPSLEERFNQEDGGMTMRQWIRTYQDKDEMLPKLMPKLELIDGVYTGRYMQDIGGKWIHPIYIPKELIGNALVSAHDKAGHFGPQKTVSILRRQFYWHSMKKTVKRYCDSCAICQQIKGERAWTTEPSAVVGGKAWSVIGVDTVKGFGTNHSVLTVTCLFTRYVFTFLLTRETAQLMCNALDQLFTAEGPPEVLVSDNAEIFESGLFEALLRAWGVRHRPIPRYAPWYGGFYEITHRTLVKTLTAVIMEREMSDWKKSLSLATFLYNCRPYEHAGDSGLSPQEVFRGRQTRKLWMEATVEYEDSVLQDAEAMDEIRATIAERRRLVEYFEGIWMDMRNSAVTEIARRQKKADPFKVGEDVYVYVPRLRRKKTDPKWAGPYPLEKKESHSIWHVNGKREHVFNLKRAMSTGLPEPDRKRELEEEMVQASRGSAKRKRLALLSVSQATRGDLLWI